VAARRGALVALACAAAPGAVTQAGVAGGVTARPMERSGRLFMRGLICSRHAAEPTPQTHVRGA